MIIRLGLADAERIANRYNKPEKYEGTGLQGNKF
jgi:hypothetical protein